MPDAILGAVAEFAAPHHGVISRRRAAELGLTPWRVEALLRKGLLRESPGRVLVFTSSPSTWLQQCAIAGAALADDGAISHRAAARLHRLDGLLEDLVEIILRARRRFPIPGVICHRTPLLPPSDIYEIEGIRVTGLARTLADLGSVVGSDLVLRALDTARRRDVSMRWVRTTAERLHRPGQRGTGVLLTLLDRIAAGDDVVPGSWFERLLELCLTDPTLPALVRQYEIRDARGRVVARPDLAVPELKLGIEAHSRRFHFGHGPESADEQRDLAAAALGWELVYLGWHAHLRPNELVAIVRQIVTARSELLGKSRFW